MADIDTKEKPVSESWMSDVQRAIALILVGTLAVCTILATTMVVFTSTPADATIDMSKTLLAALVNMGLIALGFFFGNTIAKMTQDKGQQGIVEKLTSAAPAGPIAPVTAAQTTGQVVIAWWGALDAAEQQALQDAAATDPKVAAFIEAAKTGRATADDLAYLVSKIPPLLSQARAEFLKTL